MYDSKILQLKYNEKPYIFVVKFNGFFDFVLQFNAAGSIHFLGNFQDFLFNRQIKIVQKLEFGWCFTGTN